MGGEEAEDPADQGDSVDYRHFDIWRLVHLENGLRFEEDTRWHSKSAFGVRGDAQGAGPGSCAGGGHPGGEGDGEGEPGGGHQGLFRRALNAVTALPPPCRVRGRVRAPPRLIHHLLTDVGPMRFNWDPTFLSASEVEPDAADDIGGHSNLVHLVYRPLNVWGVNCSRPRDTVLLQHWRLEDGTYLMTFTSVNNYDAKARRTRTPWARQHAPQGRVATTPESAPLRLLSARPSFSLPQLYSPSLLTLFSASAVSPPFPLPPLRRCPSPPAPCASPRADSSRSAPWAPTARSPS